MQLIVHHLISFLVQWQIILLALQFSKASSTLSRTFGSFLYTFNLPLSIPSLFGNPKSWKPVKYGKWREAFWNLWVRIPPFTYNPRIAAEFIFLRICSPLPIFDFLSVSWFYRKDPPVTKLLLVTKQSTGKRNFVRSHKKMVFHSHSCNRVPLGRPPLQRVCHPSTFIIAFIEYLT